MNPGDRVKIVSMSLQPWKSNEVYGHVVKKTRDDYTVIIWEGINGEWHYTSEQIKNIEVINK